MTIGHSDADLGREVPDTPRASGGLPTLRVFDPRGREVFWAEVKKEMLVEFFKAAQQPGEHVIQLSLITKSRAQWLIDNPPTGIVVPLDE